MHTLRHPRWISRRATLLSLAALPLAFAAAPSHAAPAAPAAAQPGEAVRLRTAWTAGERLSYDMRMDGTINMQASPNAAGNPLAGAPPLDVEVKMIGAGALEALSVDEFGTARVVPSLSALKVNASAFLFKVEADFNAQGYSFAVNGQNVARGANDKNTAILTNPPFALEISDRGRITGAVPREVTPAPAAQPSPPAAANGNARPGGMPGLDFAKLAQSMFWRAIPTLWPATAVKAGDTWNSDVTIPLPAAAAPNGLAATQLGRFDFTMRGLETVGGQRVARIAMKGGLELDNKVAKAIGDLAKQEGEKAAPEAAKRAEEAQKNARARSKAEFDTQLNKASQRVEGDLWVDPATGHIVRAEVNLDTQTTAMDVAKPGVKPKAKAAESFFDFVGTLSLQLKERTVKPAA